MSEYLSKEEIKQWRSSLERITLEEFAARLGKKIEEAKPTNDLVDIVLHGQPVKSLMSDEYPQNRTERISTISQLAYDREQEIAPSPFSITKLKLNAQDFGDRKTALKQKSVAPKSLVNKKPTVNDETSEVVDTLLMPEPSVEEKVEPKKSAPKSVATKPKSQSTRATAKSGKTSKKSTSTKLAKAKKVVIEEISGDELRDDVRVVFKKVLTDREQRVFDYFKEHKNEIVYAKDLATLLELPRDYVYKYIKNLRTKIEGDKLKNADKGGFILNI